MGTSFDNMMGHMSISKDKATVKRYILGYSKLFRVFLVVLLLLQHAKDLFF
jgi:hypothetical protein